MNHEQEQLALWTPLSDDTALQGGSRAQAQIRAQTGERDLYLALNPQRTHWVLFYAPDGNPQHPRAGAVCHEPYTAREPNIRAMVEAVVLADRERRHGESLIDLQAEAQRKQSEYERKQASGAVAEDLYYRARDFTRKYSILS